MFVQATVNIPKTAGLSGATAKKQVPDLNLSSWFSGEFQRAVAFNMTRNLDSDLRL